MVPTQLTPDLHAQVRQHLEEVLRSPQFAAASRASAFLRYVIEKALNGETDQIKESLIGIEVYGRGDSFDPQTDSIVRVEASRLRSKLREFYATIGQQSNLQFELPRGTYVPAFLIRESPPTPVEQPVAEARLTRRFRWTGIAMAAVLLGLTGTGWWMLRRANSGSKSESGIRRVAVLPFTDLSEAKDYQYFCDGLAEEVIDELSRIPGLSVLARGSSFRFRGAALDFRDIGKKLEVDRVLVGAVRHSGTRVRVTAQLVDTSTGSALWSTSLDRESKDILEIQDSISREVARSLRVQLAVDSTGPRGTEDAEARRLYLLGRFHYSKSTAEDEAQAIQYFDQAIARDPNYAAPHAGLADALASLPLRGQRTESGAIERARWAARRALEIEPKLVEGLLAQAHIARTLDYNWPEAERLYRQAIAVQPGAARPHNSLGVLLSLAGRFEEAQRELLQARSLDPLSMQVNTNLALNSYRMRSYAEAIQQAREGIAIDPNYRNIYSVLAASLAQSGQIDEALKSLEGARDPKTRLLADNHLALSGYIFARAGNKKEAQAVLQELEARAATRYVPKAAFADVWLGLGDQDRAFALMEQALANREVLLAGLLVSPHTDPVRNHPRFQKLWNEIARRS